MLTPCRRDAAYPSGVGGPVGQSVSHSVAVAVAVAKP